MKEPKFNKDAYNNCCGAQRVFDIIMGSIAAAGVHERCAAELEALVMLPTTDAIEAGHRLRTILSGVSRLGPFNVNECLQLGVLLREAHDTACDLHSDVSIRISLFQSSLYGTGGARGLTCFYPGVKDADVHLYASDLRVYMHVTHGIFSRMVMISNRICVVSKIPST